MSRTGEGIFSLKTFQVIVVSILTCFSLVNVNGIASLLSLAKLFKRKYCTVTPCCTMLAFNPRILGNTYWSKDIILLVTDESVRGMQAWLDAYHGVNFGSKSSVLTASYHHFRRY